MTDPSTHREPDTGPYRPADSAQAQFLEEVEPLRAGLHRYCTRMMGSPLDGEDVVQDTLATAFFRLDTWDRSRPLAPLLFRIAHNRCIDGLRRRRFEAGEVSETEQAAEDTDPLHWAADRQRSRRALAHIVTELPPRERSCWVLKEVVGHTLREIAEIVGGNEGAVKSALRRARTKLEALRKERPELPEVHGRDEATEALLEEYAARFTARDWPRLAELLAEDVRLDVVGILEDGTREVLLNRYITNYGALDGSWTLTPGRLNGESVLLCVRDGKPAWPIRVVLETDEEGFRRVAAVRDYVLGSHLLEGATVEVLSGGS